MKSLNLNQPLLLLLVGLPGAGKSFFARQFSLTFGAPLVSHNRIRHELFEDPNHNKIEEDLIERLATAQLEELLKTRRTIIIDGGCNAKTDRQAIIAQAKEAGYDKLIIWVQTDPATCRQRSLKRGKERPEDLMTAALTPDQFDSFAKKFTAPLKEDHIVISGKHVYATQAKIVLRKLAAPHQAEAQKIHAAEVQTAARQTPAVGRVPVRRAIIS